MEKDKIVNHPDHYTQKGIETIKLIELLLTPEEFRGYLKGNIIKYRDRAGLKTPDPKIDYDKAEWYYNYVSKEDTKCSCGGNCNKEKGNPFNVTTTLLNSENKEEKVKTVGGDKPIYFVDNLPEKQLTDVSDELEGSKDYSEFINTEESISNNDDEEEKNIIEDYLAGVPNTYIITNYGINKNKLYSILNKNKIPRKTNKSEVLDYVYAMEEDLLIEILDDYESGISKASLSDKYNLSTYEINTIIDIFRWFNPTVVFYHLVVLYYRVRGKD